MAEGRPRNYKLRGGVSTWWCWHVISQLLTDFRVVTLRGSLKLFPVDARCLAVLLEDFLYLRVRDLVLPVRLLTRSVVLVSLDGRLDTFVVEVGVVLLLELAQDCLELIDPALQA